VGGPQIIFDVRETTKSTIAKPALDNEGRSQSACAEE
jgi:hypothetical protein